MAAAEGSVGGLGQLLGPDGKVANSFGPTIVGNPTTDRKLSSSTYNQGAPPAASGQMALDKATAEKLKAGLGSRLALVTPKGKVDLTVSGVFTFGSSNSLAGATLAGVLAALSPAWKAARMDILRAITVE